MKEQFNQEELTFLSDHFRNRSVCCINYTNSGPTDRDGNQPHMKNIEIENMNHVLKIVEGDRNKNVATYMNPNLPISDELVKAIADFIKNNGSRYIH